MIDKQSAYQKIANLVERFEEQYSSYKNSDYNETLTRRDFIDPFFKALGWDMDNQAGHAEAYREVIHEDRIKIGGATKAPDYSFRLVGGHRLFFVEAKKPSIMVKDETLPAYQIRRYGWSAKLPISIITDFEEFAIYDCTKKPRPEDKASNARLRYFTFRDYLKEFDFVWETFSKERVLKGSFDKFVKSDTHKKGTASVDKEFLLSLDSWRKHLASSIALNNKGLNEEEINFAVQQVIDRIIFMRIAEDRSIEPYGNLKHTLEHGDFYRNLFDLFRRADEKYNSGLFDFKKDRISEKLKIDNKVIKTVINELYFPASPYEFSVLPVEILGSAYEQFLGKVIRITPAHHVKIEEKPEVRKAGGVYYTPQYVVDFIIKNTLGLHIETKTKGLSIEKAIKEVAKLKIVDPSCGSGSFLIGAYQFLLDWHFNLLHENDNKKGEGKKKSAALTADGRLSTSLKKEILLNNIFGVDIDVNAVEVTKLSLLLKCMEGETEASIATQLRMFNERVLPTLDDNIKSGNSLIDFDFYDTQLDFGEEKKIKPFSWQKSFLEIFKGGGFDIVIGNPPWGADLSEESLDYLKAKHSSIVVRMVDSYMYFINHSIDLLNDSGSFGMIIPSGFLNQADMKLIRKKIVDRLNLKMVINLGEKIFGPKVLNTSTILLFDKGTNETKDLLIGDIRDIQPAEKGQALELLKPSKKTQWVKLVQADEQSTYFTFNTDNVALLNKLKKKFPPFKDAVDGEVQRGISPDFAKAFILSKKEAAIKKIEKKILKPLVLGKHISRYSEIESDDVILYLTAKHNIDEFPNAKAHLLQFRKHITCKEVAEGKHPWYALHRPRNPEIFLGRKFIGLTTTKRLCIAQDDSGYYATDSLYLFKTKQGLNENVVLAIFHSKLFQFLYNTAIQGGQRVIPQVKAVALYDLPFPQSIKDDSAIDNMVGQLKALYAELKQNTLSSNIEHIEGKIDYCENKIDEMIYNLYDLTKEEIDLVNG